MNAIKARASMETQQTVVDISSLKVRRRLSWYTWGLVVFTWCIAMLGAYVRLSDAGLGCPDWPGCYGYWFVPEHPHALAHVQHKFPSAVVEPAKAWKEMIHRYGVSILGLGILGLVIALEKSARYFKKRWVSAFWSVWVITWLIAQALFGMWTVTLKLTPLIVTLHLMGGILLLVWMTTIATQLSRYNPFLKLSLPKWMIGSVWAGVLLQIFLGGWVSSNYAAGACGNSFPLCQGVVWPEMMNGENWKKAFELWHPLGLSSSGEALPAAALVVIHWMHRAGAIVVTGAVSALSFYCIQRKQYRRWGIWLIHALALQLFLGFANVAWGLPIWSAVAHNGGAALLLVILTVMWNSSAVIKLNAGRFDRK